MQKDRLCFGRINIKNKQTMQENNQTSSNQETNYPKNYYLFSVVCVLDGKQHFIDIPVYSHKLSFPTRGTIYRFTCDYLEIDMESNLVSMFAILNIFEFKCVEDYESYIGNSPKM